MLAALAVAPSADAQESAPLSAIDWLSQTVVPAAPGDGGFVTDIASDARPPEVTVTPLDALSLDGVGLLAPEETGLPADLWSASTEADLVALLSEEERRSLPAIHDLIRLLALAEAEPPLAAGPEGRLFLARVDRLLEMGAVQDAAALLDAAPGDRASVLRRAFDTALLLGTENVQCRRLAEVPSLTPTVAARVFCLARGGDWPAAALTLNTARALGDVTLQEEELLARFLDPELFEGMEGVELPDRISPLVFLMLEAIGEPIPTATLPVAFANSDLRDTVAWRQQIEAAERLVRAGGIDGATLFELYLKQRPGASGGVWDRAALIQDLEAALAEADPAAVSELLPRLWQAMQDARLEVAFAEHYAAELLPLPLAEEADRIAWLLGLLSAEFEAVAAGRPSGTGRDRLLSAVARGAPQGIAPGDPRDAAILAAWTGAEIPAALQAHLDEGRTGEALLRAVSRFNQGLSGEPAALTEALATFRAAGLEETARRAALQALILDRDG